MAEEFKPKGTELCRQYVSRPDGKLYEVRFDYEVMLEVIAEAVNMDATLMKDILLEERQIFDGDEPCVEYVSKHNGVLFTTRGHGYFEAKENVG